MNSQQYEEICRYFLAEELKINVNEIQSVNIPNPTRPGLPQYKHQIDLYWETQSQLASYLNIANAKWRGNAKVDQQEVMLLQQVRQKVAAHKAFMLTTQGYTSGAIAAAKDEGITLLIVKPTLDFNLLPTKDRNAIYDGLKELASTSNQPIYSYEIVHKAFDFTEISTQVQSSHSPSGTPAYETKIVSGDETRIGGNYSNKASPLADDRGVSETYGGSPSKNGGDFFETK